MLEKLRTRVDFSKITNPYSVLAIFLSASEALLLYWFSIAESVDERQFIGSVMITLFVGVLVVIVLLRLMSLRAPSSAPPPQVAPKQQPEGYSPPFIMEPPSIDSELEGEAGFLLAEASKQREAGFLDQALAKYRKADALVARGKRPETFARIQHGIGLLHLDMAPRGEPERHLRNAVDAFEKTIRVWTKDTYPLDYAATQNNLGIAYGDLAAVREKEANLKHAVEAYREALKIYTSDSYPDLHRLVMENFQLTESILAEL